MAGWPGQPAIEKSLWALAESLLPQTDMVAYTQGLMDLGATLCTRSKPRCSDCPLAIQCISLRDGLTAQLPTPKPKPRKAMPQKQTVMLLLLAGSEILLEKRPPSGIWGGLWSLPEIGLAEDPQQAAQWRYGLETRVLPALPGFKHAFTHFRLHVTPQPLLVVTRAFQAREPGALWLDIEQALGAALPTPVRKLLQNLQWPVSG
jgi:A/G-specific adenine glycosylase